MSLAMRRTVSYHGTGLLRLCGPLINVKWQQEFVSTHQSNSHVKPKDRFRHLAKSCSVACFLADQEVTMNEEPWNHDQGLRDGHHRLMY